VAGKKIRRKIDFFKFRQNEADRAELDVDSVWAALASLNDDERVLALPDGTKFFHKDASDQTHKRLILAMSSKGDRPMQEQNLVLSDLPMPKSAGISYQTHMIFFPPNLVGVEYRKNAAKITHLQQILNKNTVVGTFKFEACLEENFVQRLESMEYIDWYSLRVNKSQANIIEEASAGIASGVRAELEDSEAQSVDLVFRCYTRLPKKPKRSRAKNQPVVQEAPSEYDVALEQRASFTKKAKSVILALSKIPQMFGHTKVHGRDGLSDDAEDSPIQTYDFMSHKIIGLSRKIKEGPNFVIDSEDMFKSIISVEATRHDDLIDPTTFEV
jgi:hypothetical protein